MQRGPLVARPAPVWGALGLLSVLAEATGESIELRPLWRRNGVSGRIPVPCRCCRASPGQGCASARCAAAGCGVFMKARFDRPACSVQSCRSFHVVGPWCNIEAADSRLFPRGHGRAPESADAAAQEPPPIDALARHGCGSGRADTLARTPRAAAPAHSRQTGPGQVCESVDGAPCDIRRNDNADLPRRVPAVPPAPHQPQDHAAPTTGNTQGLGVTQAVPSGRVTRPSIESQASRATSRSSSRSIWVSRSRSATVEAVRALGGPGCDAGS